MSRYLVIALAFIVAAVQFSRGALFEAAGLLGLGTGLAALKLGGGRPAAKYTAFAGFAITVAAFAVVAIRRLAT